MAIGFPSWRRAAKVPLILQGTVAECGLACVAMVAAFHGQELDLIELRRRFPASSRGMTLQALFRIGQRLNMVARGLRIAAEDVAGLQLPAILHWDHGHYVVLTKVGRRSVAINDPADGVTRYSWVEFAKHFTGFALELRPSENFEVKRTARKLRLRDLFGRVPEVRALAVQTALLSILLQIFAVISPLYIKVAVDEVAVTGDDSALLGLALGFTLLAMVNALIDRLRAVILTKTGGVISYSLATNLFNHFTRLPLPWFEQRHIGDMASKFAATDPIKKFVTEELPAALVDGVMVGILMVALSLSSAKLAGIVIASFSLCLALRWTTLTKAKELGQDMVRAEGLEHSAFVETALAIQSIKIAGREAERQSYWQNRYARALRARLGYTQFQSGLTALAGAIVAIENVIIIYAAIVMNLSGEMSLGLVFTFLAYRQQFVDKGARLINAAQELRLLDLHLDRVADIALNERESSIGDAALVPARIEGAVRLRDLCFRYAEYEKELLSGIDLSIAPGEFVAVTGPSGGGKTTLMKIMLGLFEPTAGEVLIDGKPLRRLGLNSFRSQIGVVLQDDHLLSGTIADNICFFDSEIDIGWMRDCATMAGIDAEIMAMPMNYNTVLGDMGQSLSGGQRQRVLLARALYRRPKMLFMDEGTSHLDVDKEMQVNQALASLSITRIIIAHRPDTVRAADRVLLLKDGGTLVELTPDRRDPKHHPHLAPVLHRGGGEPKDLDRIEIEATVDDGL